MHRASAFFSWLLAKHPVEAEAFRAFGLPTNTSRLYVLLRTCKDAQRSRVRQWHRQWRIHRKFEELRRTGKIVRLDADLDLTPIPDDGLIHGIKRSGEITFELNFDAPGLWAEMMSLFYYQHKPQRWDRVWRRWQFKHTDPCFECGGEGTYLDAPQNVLDGGTYMTTCHVCEGTGRFRKPMRIEMFDLEVIYHPDDWIEGLPKKDPISYKICQKCWCYFEPCPVCPPTEVK